MTPKQYRRGLVWFRADLRLDDAVALHAALDRCEEVVPVYVWDPLWEGEWSADWPRMGRTGALGWGRMSARRRRFLEESVSGLRAGLEARGGGLWELDGPAGEVLARAAAAWGCDGGVFAARGHCPEEAAQEAALGQRLPCHWEEGLTLLHPDDLPFDVADLPPVFTSFRHKVERRWEVRDPLPAPAHVPVPGEGLPAAVALRATAPLAVDGRSLFPFPGGEPHAWARMAHFLEGSGAIAHYKQTRNGLLAIDDASRLSPYLAVGALSPRRLHAEIRAFEARHGATEDTYWMIFELLWRDYFRFAAMQAGPALFRKPPKGSGDSRARRAFESWCAGTTGHAWVDAHMRELAATGYMTNRGRQNVASYLVHDLGVSWTWGAAWFEHHLLDFDAASNTGNWQYLAGVGADPRPQRKFNMEKQAADYDPDGAYRRRWQDRAPDPTP